MEIEIWVPIFVFQFFDYNKEYSFLFHGTTGKSEKAWDEQRLEGNEEQSQII